MLFVCKYGQRGEEVLILEREKCIVCTRKEAGYGQIKISDRRLYPGRSAWRNPWRDWSRYHHKSDSDRDVPDDVEHDGDYDDEDGGGGLCSGRDVKTYDAGLR